MSYYGWLIAEMTHRSPIKDLGFCLIIVTLIQFLRLTTHNTVLLILNIINTTSHEGLKSVEKVWSESLVRRKDGMI